LQPSPSSIEFVSTVAGLTAVTCPVAACASNRVAIGVVTLMLNSCGVGIANHV